MKLLLLIATILLSISSYAQSIKQLPDGNYEFIKKVKDTTQLKWSGHTIVDTDGTTKQVYVSPRAQKLYIVRVSKKSGRKYNYYLPINDRP